MLCEHCKKNAAITIIKTNINGMHDQYNLCQQCAMQLGVSEVFNGINISSLLGGFFDEGVGVSTPSVKQAARCEQCGASFNEIAKSGKVGCFYCYTKFFDLLEPSLIRLHGKSQHVGKELNCSKCKPDYDEQIKEQESKLQTAITEQKFEDAAKYRDKINELKQTQADADAEAGELNE